MLKFNVINVVLVLLVIVAVVEVVHSNTTKKPGKGGKAKAKKGGKGSKAKGKGIGVIPDNQKFKDENGKIWPDFCKKIPGPELNTFVGLSEPFPCFKLTKAMIGAAKEKQDAEKTTPGKCGWDYVLCFLMVGVL